MSVTNEALVNFCREVSDFFLKASYRMCKYTEIMYRYDHDYSSRFNKVDPDFTYLDIFDGEWVVMGVVREYDEIIYGYIPVSYVLNYTDEEFKEVMEQHRKSLKEEAARRKLMEKERDRQILEQAAAQEKELRRQQWLELQEEFGNEE